MKRTPEEQAKWLSELPSHRLAFEDVERRSKSPALDLPVERLLIDHTAATGIDHQGTVRQCCQDLGVNQMSGVVVEGHVHAQDVAATGHLEGARGMLDTQLLGLFGRQGTAPGHDAHTEGGSPVRHLLADPAHSQQAESRAVDPNSTVKLLFIC